MDLIMDPEKTPEEILLESFYVLKELHWNMPLTTELVEDYFSEKTIRQLEHAINEIELPVLDTMDECNELLQDLAVNYRKEGLYRKYLEPVVELAEELSEEYEEKELVEAREDFYRKFRVYEDLLRSFLANEVYSDLLTPEGDLGRCPGPYAVDRYGICHHPPGCFSSVAGKMDGDLFPTKHSGLYGSDLQNDRI